MINTQRKEALSLSYLNAICAYNEVAVEPQKYDADSIDCFIKKQMTKKDGRKKHALIGIQLKSTSQKLVENNEYFSYELEIKNFNELRDESVYPKMLCVLILPHNEDEWLSCSIDKLILRHCMYWCNPVDWLDSSNKSTVNIHVLKKNAITPASIIELMQNVAETDSL